MADNVKDKPKVSQTKSTSPAEAIKAAIFKVLKNKDGRVSLSSILLTERTVKVLVGIVFFQIGLVYLAFIALFALAAKKAPEPDILAAFDNGTTRNLMTISSPNISLRGLTNSMIVNAGYCLSFDSNSSAGVFDYCSKNIFTSAGMNAYRSAIQNTDLGMAMNSGNAYIIESYPYRTPTVTRSGMYGFGETSFEMQIPMVISIELIGSRPSDSQYVVTMRVIKVTGSKNTNSYKINEIFIERIGR